MSRIHLVVGDTRPQVFVQLLQPQAPVDVQLATVHMKFRARRSATVLFQLTGELLAGTLQQDLITADLSQYPGPGSGGRVKFTFLEGALDLDPGYYEGEIEIDFGGNNTFTPYQKLQFLLRQDF